MSDNDSAQQLAQPCEWLYFSGYHLNNRTHSVMECAFHDFPVQFSCRQKFHKKYQNALQVLEMEQPTTYSDIRRQFREMVKRSHPDRGGCRRTFQKINEAMTIVHKYHSR